jgi:hypothetical protein
VSEWLRRTGQQWKLKLGMAWILASILLLIVVIVAGALTLPLIVAALAFAAAGFAWTAFAVRCPACRRRAVFWSMVHEPGHQWLIQMSTANQCPICGDRADPRT